MHKKEFKALVNHLRKQSYHTVEIDGHYVQFRWSYVGNIPAIIFVQSRDYYFGSIHFNKNNTLVNSNSDCTNGIIVTMLQLSKEFEVK